mgnify:CR=1 FL=1
MAIIIHELEHRYEDGSAGEKVALHDVNIKIEQGEMIGLIGHTGSGKSTLIQHLNGLLKPTSGAVFYDGKDINDSGFSKKKLRSKVGLVFQYPEYQLFASTVEADVAFGPQNMKLSKEEIDERTREAIASVGLDFDEVSGKSPFELSGGEKRRVALAGVLAMRPSVLVLDEPTAGLDPRGKKEILDLVVELRKNHGKTIVMISHDMNEVYEYASRVAVFVDGTVKYLMSPEELFRKSDELEGIGLEMPQMAALSNRLEAEGINLGCRPRNVSAMTEAVLDYARAHGKLPQTKEEG